MVTTYLDWAASHWKPHWLGGARFLARDSGLLFKGYCLVLWCFLRSPFISVALLCQVSLTKLWPLSWRSWEMCWVSSDNFLIGYKQFIFLQSFRRKLFTSCPFNTPFQHSSSWTKHITTLRGIRMLTFWDTYNHGQWWVATLFMVSSVALRACW